jgi:non-heme chloroperoxidase
MRKMPKPEDTLDRRDILGLMAGVSTGLATLAAAPSSAAPVKRAPPVDGPTVLGSETLKTTDGVTIFYKDWGPKAAQPIVFHHGWPLTADDWDNQMMCFLLKGYRVIAHDHRGHGRSSATFTGNDMDHYAADMAAIAAHLDLKNADHAGHSTGGGEATRYFARHGGNGGGAKAVLIGAIRPIMLKTASNPGGLPMEVFDGFRSGLAGNRAQFYTDIPTGPFYGFNQPGAKVQAGVIANWFRQAMMGDSKSQYDCIVSFSETDFTADLTAITVPVLLLYGEDDQVVPIENTAKRAVKLLKMGALKTYPSLTHGMTTAHPDLIKADLLAFFRN